MTPLETVYTPWVAGLRWNDPASQQTKTGCQSRHPYSPLSTGSTTPQSSQNTWNLFWIPGKKLKRNHTLTLHLSRNKYRIEYLFVSAAATNLQYNCFALKFTFYVLWLKRNAHTHFVFSNNSKRTYMFCLSSAQKTGIRFGFFLVMPLTIAKSRMRFSSSLPRLPLPAGGKAWILMLMSFWCIFSGC